MTILGYPILFLLVFFFTSLALSKKLFKKKYIYDEAFGPQKVHLHLTPRIGGITCLVGLMTFSVIFFNQLPEELFLIIFCSLPAFISGATEDLTKSVSKYIRLIACLMSGYLAAAFDIRIISVGIPAFDFFVENTYFSIFITILAVGFLAQAINIIDGLNGMALLSTIIPMFALLLISTDVSDENMMILIGIFLIAFACLLLFNFPFGKLFLGDGGAYMLGVVLAALIILLSSRNAIAPFACLLLVFYPMFEMFFTIFRRFFFQKTAVMEADARHLHSLIYQTVKSKTMFSDRLCNPVSTCICVFPIAVLSMLAYIFRFDNFDAAIANAICVVFYVTTYFYLKKNLEYE